MVTIGLDIGTTTISAVAADDIEGVWEALTVNNNSFLEKQAPWESLQQTEQILDNAIAAVHTLLEHHPDARCIGVTGQQHGIVYLDADGNALGPLYTWQDGRGDRPCSEEESYAEHLSRLSCMTVMCGYGMATHYYNIQNHLVPEGACVFCTIGDYVAMKMAGLQRPCMDASNAASLGLFDLERNAFDAQAAGKAGISSELFPEVAAEPRFLGNGMFGIPVSTAIGDNQASYLGATRGNVGSILVNVGTGSQFSAYSHSLQYCPGLETRPFPLGGYLLVGASLCGGRAYALLEHFFSEIVKMATGKEISCYNAMAALLESNPKTDDYPVVSTTFDGTRQQPNFRGSFTQVSISNMTPLHWIWGVIHGITDELYDMYRTYMASAEAEAPSTMIGSGNGLRKNRFLCETMSKAFGCELLLSPNEEEAAFGAALFAGTIEQK